MPSRVRRVHAFFPSIRMAVERIQSYTADGDATAAVASSFSSDPDKGE